MVDSAFNIFLVLPFTRYLRVFIVTDRYTDHLVASDYRVLTSSDKRHLLLAKLITSSQALGVSIVSSTA
jgi:hypothetical protein